ncbi:putative leucine-rich repeat-containing, plant-type, leucine-rich repeat domain superfamily [Helianthus anomalus]
MSNLILLFCFLSLFFISSTTSSINTTHKCSLQQTLDLLHFKHSINNTLFEYDSECKNWLGSRYNQIMLNWNTGTDCCEWNGVTCDDSTGDVIGLDMSCGMLQGTIHPNTTLFHLPRLQRLNLAYNNFTDSQFPPAIGRLSNSLTHLNISSCEFTGQVPTTISHLHKLVSLDLSSNGDDFNLEPHVFINLLQNLTVVKELSLTYVNISAVLPSNLSISSALKLLNLGWTGLQGNLPRNIFILQSLETLDLSYNSFTGHIPSEVSLLPNLVSLDLSGNGIDLAPHIFSSLLINSNFLRDLYLSDVNIGIVLPTYLNISSSIRSLHLRETRLQVKLPDNILDLKYLEYLDLSRNNNLSGPFPKVNTSTSIPLRMLDLSGCGLNGSLPKSLGNLRYLESLYLSDNKLSGTLPFSLFTLPSLKYLFLDKNQLTGQINVLDNSPHLQTFQRLTNLTSLDLSYNNFRGDWELDALLSSLTNLHYLTLSHSGISVTTSNANHYVYPGLHVLGLASCSLKLFPMSIRTMTNLLLLDLSNNDIQGHMPDWIGEIGGNQLFVLDLSNNSINGTIPNVFGNWSILWAFILNGNQLEGKVPTSLYKCKNLRIIDMGNNQLSDIFPSWLGDLPKLHTLVLRSNNFHGGIVTSSKVKFPFPSLRVLDLSHNGFVGQLPAKYFQKFSAMKNVVEKNTKPTYMSLGTLYYYSITIVMKGVDRYFSRLSVQYTIVDLSNNKFKGDIPNIIGNLNSLKVLNLSHNSLTGQIPHAFGNISEIESLDLSWNQLTGEIPQSLADLTFLEILNLSQNHLMGHIPQGKQFNTFDNYSFGGNSKLCGLPLTKKCGEHLHELQLEGDGDEEESGFTWKVVVMGYGCGTLLGMVLGYIMLSTGRPKWFSAIADVANHMILNMQNKRR